MNSENLAQQVKQHQFLTAKKNNVTLNRKTVDRAIGQYWYPIHYFPDFLASVVFQAQALEVKTFVSKILFQELGEGNPERAHETFYIGTMTDVGFDHDVVCRSAPSLATKRLMEKYESATKSFEAGLGVLVGTESIDIYIVSGLGSAVRSVTGAKKLPWFDIHVEQEPDHTDYSARAMNTLSEASKSEVERHACEILSLWLGFFDDLISFENNLQHVSDNKSMQTQVVAGV